jgi:hypothetical protein
MPGGAGTAALTAKVWLTLGAGRNLASPAWSARIVHPPALTAVSSPDGVTLQTLGVADWKLTVRPELALATKRNVVPKI